MRILLLLLLALPLWAQAPINTIQAPGTGTKFSATDPTGTTGVLGSAPNLTFGGNYYTCQGGTIGQACTYALVPGGSVTNLDGSATYAKGPAATNSVLTTAPYTGAPQRTANDKFNDLPSVTDFGAVGDAVTISDAAMTASSHVLTTAHVFTSADVSKQIVVGAAGANGPGLNLISTIASVASGVATLTDAAANTVTAQSASFGTDNQAAFALAVLRTAGTGFSIPAGIYMGTNTGGLALINLTTWSGAVQFMPGSSVLCTYETGTNCVAAFGPSSTNLATVKLLNPEIYFAGATGPKTAGGANGIFVNHTTNSQIVNPLIHGTGAGSCIVEQYNLRLMSSNVQMDYCNDNGFYSVSSQDTTLLGLVSKNTGDYALEVDNCLSAACGNTGDATNSGFTGTGIKCLNSFGCVISDSKIGLSISDIQGTNLCNGGVVITNSFATPTKTNLGKITLDGVGTYTDPNWGSGVCGTGNGQALAINGSTNAHLGSVHIINSGGNKVLNLSNNAFVSAEDVALSNNTGTVTIDSNGYARIADFHVDNASSDVHAGSNTVLAGNFWDFYNMCLAGSCSHDALFLPSNGFFDIGSLGLNDNQTTPTGYIIQATGTVNQSTISHLHGIITNGATACGSNTICIAQANVDSNVAINSSSYALAVAGATGSSNHSSNPLLFCGSYGNGTASANDCVSVSNILGSGTNPTSNLTFTHSGGTAGASLTYLANFFIGSTIAFNSFSKIRSTVDGSVQLGNAANTGFTSLLFGGTSSSFPQLHVNATALEAKLADNSTYSPFSAGVVATIPRLTSALPTCTASTGTPWRASVSDATAPALGIVLTGGGTVFANVHCSLTTGTYLVDGL